MENMKLFKMLDYLPDVFYNWCNIQGQKEVFKKSLYFNFPQQKTSTTFISEYT